MALAKPTAKKPAKSLGDKLAAKTSASKKIAGSDAPERTHTYNPKFKAPKSLALAADKLWEKQQELKKAQEIAARIEAEASDLKAWLIENLPKSQAQGITGKYCNVKIVPKDVPRAQDWPKVYASIVENYQSQKRKKTGQEDAAFAILQRRLGESAIKEMWEAGEAIPGVVSFRALSLSITKP